MSVYGKEKKTIGLLEKSLLSLVAHIISYLLISYSILIHKLHDSFGGYFG